MSSAETIVNKALQNRYQNGDKTKREVFKALKHYRGIAPKLEKFVFNDGKEKEFLNLDGTIPVRYKGMKYNIPICIWLLDNYPFSAPMVYVKPTIDMLIKSSKHVDQNGKVYLPYLHEWNPNASDLMGLIQILIMTFAEVPPVYAKPKSNSPVHYQTPYPTQPHGYMPIPSTGSSGASPLPYPTMPSMPGAAQPPTSYPPYPTGQAMPAGPGYPLYPPSSSMYPSQPASNYQTPYPSNQTSFPPYMPPTDTSSASPPTQSLPGTITEEHIKASLVSAVSDKVKGRLRDVYGGFQAEASSLRQQQSDLNAGKLKLENLMSKLSTEQTELDKNIKILNEKHTEFESILSKMEEATDPLDIDEAVTTTAPIYKKLLACYAEDQAISDAIYYLGEALRRGIIDLDSYLKNVRSLSRSQFQVRAMMNKCRSKANLPG